MKKLTALAALLCTLSLTVCTADAAKTPPVAAPTTEEQKTLYALGMLISQSLSSFELKPEELAMVQKGINDGVTGREVGHQARRVRPEGAGPAAGASRRRG
jgi:hypothetical protein